jgi:predicted SprT family Zn-dependent metalloprotease
MIDRMGTLPPVVSAQLSTERLHEIWQQLNLRYFEGRLSPIAILWSPRLTASVGMFVSRGGPKAPPSASAPSDKARRLIRLSLPLLRDQAEQEIVGTLAHEMIHQWQFDVLCRRPNHGAEFCRVMARMNLDGLGITIRHSLDRAVQALTKYTWRCTECGCEYHRQRKTIRPRRHRCGACLGKLRELPRVVEESYVVSTGSAMSSSESPPARAVTDQAASCLQLVLPYVGS